MMNWDSVFLFLGDIFHFWFDLLELDLCTLVEKFCESCFDVTFHPLTIFFY